MYVYSHVVYNDWTCILVQARASTREMPYKGKPSCYICFVVVSVFTWVKQIWYDLLEFTTRKYFNKNRNTGYPALDPTKNKYLSGSGWEMMYLCFVSLFCVFLEAVYVFVCFYKCFFDCKCNSLNRLGENRQTNRNETEKLREKQTQQKYRISSPRPDQE